VTEVSHADRIVFPDAGITKGEVVGYYEAIGPTMLPHVAGRPLTLQRFPKGITAKGFMQKNAPDHFPPTIGRIEVPKQDGVTVYPVVTEAHSLPYLANQGTITFHVWSTTVDHLETPDRIVFDLDPDEGDLAGVRRAASLVKELLEDLGLDCVPVATGSKGYHVVAPVAPTIDYEQVSHATQAAATLLAQRHEDLLTVEFRKTNRRGRVFVDWLRNHGGATSVAPWSLRPRPGAPVAVPLAWDELAGTAPDAVHLRDLDHRRGDPLVALMDDPPDATDAVAAIEAMVEEAGVEIAPFDRFRS
jgi:bifunctional non-homologous end joining protein LigD